MVESLKIIFGSMENIRDPKFYASSSEEHRNEREIPPYMVAVAATAVYFLILPFVYIIVTSSTFALGLRHPATLPSQCQQQQY